MKDVTAKYLAKQANLAKWPLRLADHAGLRRAVVIPALGELRTLFQTLASLAANPAGLLRETLVICVVNNRKPPHVRPEDIEQNAETLRLLRDEAGASASYGLRIGIIDAASPGNELGEQDGVGMARKLGLDWAAAVLSENGHPEGALLSLDADTQVDANYLPAIAAHFDGGNRWAAVLDFEHATDGNSPETAAIVSYETFLRYHVLGLERAGSPYAMHTLGSAMACTCRAYAAVRGMPRKQAAEDFYFLQQLAKTGAVHPLHGTVIHPSARASHRVPFGTGRSISAALDADQGGPCLAAPPTAYRLLGKLFEAIHGQLDEEPSVMLSAVESVYPELAVFLRENGFARDWERIQCHAKSRAQRMSQFHTWFDALQTIRLLHHLRDHGFPEDDVFTCAAVQMGLAASGEILALSQRKTLLFTLRSIQREPSQPAGINTLLSAGQG